MDPVALSAIQAVQPAGAAHSPAIAPGSAPAPVANPSAITRFEAAMGVDAPQGVSEIPFASQVSAVWRSAQASPNCGRSIPSPPPISSNCSTR